MSDTATKRMLRLYANPVGGDRQVSDGEVIAFLLTRVMDLEKRLEQVETQDMTRKITRDMWDAQYQGVPPPVKFTADQARDMQKAMSGENLNTPRKVLRKLIRAEMEAAIVGVDYAEVEAAVARDERERRTYVSDPSKPLLVRPIKPQVFGPPNPRAAEPTVIEPVVAKVMRVPMTLPKKKTPGQAAAPSATRYAPYRNRGPIPSFPRVRPQGGGRGT